MNKTFLALILLVLCAPVSAEIEKIALPCNTGMCLYWWPKLPKIVGWHHERESSYSISANALAPDGNTFKNADTVIYAKAFYKPRLPQTKSLAQFIADDKQQFLGNSPDIVISEVDELSSSDGNKFQSFTYFPALAGNWERVAYGEEGEFYLVFTISSRTKAGFEKAITAYKSLVASYSEKLKN